MSKILSFEEWCNATGANGPEFAIYPMYEAYLDRLSGECHSCRKVRPLNNHGACSSCERDSVYEAHNKACYCDAWETCDAR
jgi:hypothetical protein